jgi:hypothetical protein
MAKAQYQLAVVCSMDQAVAVLLGILKALEGHRGIAVAFKITDDTDGPAFLSIPYGELAVLKKRLLEWIRDKDEDRPAPSDVSKQEPEGEVT